MGQTAYWTNGDKITAERLNEIEDCISPEIFIIEDQYNTLSYPFYVIQDAFTSGKNCIILSGSTYIVVFDIGGTSNNYYVEAYTATDINSYPYYNSGGDSV